MSSSIFPANFPLELARVAFISGNEAAWQQGDSLSVIDWLAENSYAILGFELWLPLPGGMIRTAIATDAGPTLYVWSCDRTKDEAWEHYVQRSARETAKLVSDFRWPEDALESSRPAYFNLCWADSDWFEKNASHIADE